MPLPFLSLISQCEIIISLPLTSFPMIEPGFQSLLRELFHRSPELFRCSPELFHRSPGTRLLRLSVSIQVHLYPQLKREICIFWKSFIAKAGIWTKDLSHRSSALILLSYREMVEEGGFISQTVDSVCNFFDRKLPGRSNFSFLFFYLN